MGVAQLAEKVADKIREMAKILDEEYVAQALNIPVDIIHDVLAGKIIDDSLGEFDPNKSSEIQIVKQKSRKTIGIFSINGCGATTLTASLAALATKRTDLPVVAVDLNEYAFLGYALGFDVYGEQTAFYPNILFWNSDVKGSITQHPLIKNLFIVFGATTTERYAELNQDKIISSIKLLTEENSSVWVDCPKSPFLWKNIIPCLDLLIFVVNPDIASITSLWQASSLFQKQKSKTLVVVNERSSLDAEKMIKDITGLNVIAILPDDPDLRKAANRSSSCYVYENPKSEYSETVEQILDAIWPETRKKQKSLLNNLASVFKRG